MKNIDTAFGPEQEDAAGYAVTVRKWFRMNRIITSGKAVGDTAEECVVAILGRLIDIRERLEHLAHAELGDQVLQLVQDIHRIDLNMPGARWNYEASRREMAEAHEERKQLEQEAAELLAYWGPMEVLRCALVGGRDAGRGEDDGYV